MNRKYLKLHSLFWLILLLPSICYTQATETSSQWMTLESPKKDLLFDVPDNFLINNENDEQAIFAFQNNATMSVRIIVKGSPESILKSHRRTRVEPDVKVSQFQLGSFIGDVLRQQKGKKLSLTIYAASSKVFYSISIAANDLSNPTFGKLVRSIKLENTPLFDQQSVKSENNTSKVSIETLQTSPIILEVLKAKEVKKITNSKNDEIIYAAKDEKKIEDENNYSRQLIILKNFQPSYTDRARRENIMGNVKLKVQFQADGSVGDVIVLSKLNKDLDRSSVEAARKTKFLPAQIDGKPVDIFKGSYLQFYYLLNELFDKLFEGYRRSEMMKKLLALTILTLASASIGLAQDTMKPADSKMQMEAMDEKSPTDADKVSKFDADGKIKRGSAIGTAKKVSLAKAMKDPNKYSGKTILVEGVIVRSCKMEGCWLELAPKKDAAAVRIKMKDHAFFVPLDAAGLNAKVEGVMAVKTLSKAEVEHLMNEDGAKFDKINADGTVTEISFIANGVELKKN